MKRALLVLIAAGVLFASAFGLHAGLIALAEGDGAWSERASAACAGCHGS